MENERRATRRPGPYGPSEVDDGSGLDEHELLATFGVGRELERVAIGGLRGARLRVDPAFVDRVMAAVATEPLPAPTVALRSSSGRLGPRRLRDLVVIVGDAFRVAFGPDRPSAVRAPAMAMVAVLIAVVGLGGLAGVYLVGGLRGGGPEVNLPGVGGLPSASVEPSLPPSSLPPSSTTPTSPADAVLSPTPLVTPVVSVSPSPTPRASAAPRASLRPASTPRPTAPPTPTPSQTPTPHPTETPDGSHSAEPNGTAEPTSTPESTSGGGG